MHRPSHRHLQDADSSKAMQETSSIGLANRTDDQLFSQRRMHFKSRVSATTVYELLLDDDCTLKATTEEDMQINMALFADAYNNSGLVISWKKTVIIQQPSPNAAYDASQVDVNGAQLQAVGTSIYLGSILSRNAKNR
nr:unnamed protein product [Spirometra erinaceieuropaei]